MSAIVLYRIDRAKHMHRFYRLDVQADLFGKWYVVREWGRIGTAGRERLASFPNPAAAQAALDNMRRAKERRGYRLSAEIGS